MIEPCRYELDNCTERMHRKPCPTFVSAILIALGTAFGCAHRASVASQAPSPAPMPAPRSSTLSIVQATLTAPGNPAFQLKATITEGRDPDPVGHVEIVWLAPRKWRRTIESRDFSQTLVANGSKVFEQDSDDYFPIELRTLATAMVDPQPILEAHRPGDQLLTKANRRSDESGMICFSDARSFCAQGHNGLTEIVGLPGHSVSFSDYQDFKGMRVARVVVDTVGVGESLTAGVTEIKELRNPDDALFSVPQPTPEKNQIRVALVPEVDLQSRALGNHKIIWPQVLDGKTTGTASFYVSVDRSGQVREALPVYTDNERSNDSARRQIMRWRFKPFVKHGSPIQTGSILTFQLNTRSWGPPAPISDAEVRKLASNVVNPVIPPGLAPSGTLYTLWAAVDSDGTLIEVIPAEGIPGLFQPCYQALQKWHFSPIIENGQPRPYRAEIKFRVP